MGLRKRFSESRERSARERAKRREERRRAERAKAGTTAADRSKARAERAKARSEQVKPQAESKAEATPAAEPKPKAKAKTGADRKPKTEAKPKADKPKTERKPKADKPKAKPKAGREQAAKPRRGSKPEAKAKVTAAKPARFRRKAPDPSIERPGKRRPAVATRGRAVVVAGAGKVGTGIRSVVAEVLKLGREMVAIPVGLWLAGAEIAGGIVLKAWAAVVRPVLLWIWRTGRAALRYAQDHVKPAHGLIAVGLVAIGALVASQWMDYHSVTVGTDAYSGTVGSVAPAPEIETEIAGEAHSWLMIPLAVLALVVLTLAVSGRRRAAALLIPIGVAVIAIALIVDLPKGLDEGTASIAYEGASASLLEGFWMQIACAVVLIGCGLLLPRALRPAPRRAAARPTGPTLFQSGAAAARRLAKRRPKLKLPARSKRRARRPRPRRKVQGAGT